MTTPLPQAILFDLDDTIIAFDQGAAPTWRITAEQFAPRLPDTTADALLEAIDQTRSAFWSDPERHRTGRLDLTAARRTITAQALAALGHPDEPLAVAIADAYQSLRDASIAPFPGALETLARLRQQGVALALITNGSQESQRAKIRRFDLEQYFDLILVEGEFGAGKPDERIYAEALGRLGVRPEETWMVGDNLEWDVAAPQRLGLTAIWVDVAGRGLPVDSPVRPDRTVRAIAELLN